MATFLLFINLSLKVYMALIFFRALLSWAPDLENGALGRFSEPLARITDPLILMCREILYSIFKLLNVDANRLPFDFSPVLAIIIVQIASSVVTGFSHML